MTEDIDIILDELRNIVALLDYKETHWFWEWQAHQFVRTYVPAQTPKTMRISDLYYYDPKAPRESPHSFQSLMLGCRISRSCPPIESQPNSAKVDS